MKISHRIRYKAAPKLPWWLDHPLVIPLGYHGRHFLSAGKTSQCTPALLNERATDYRVDVHFFNELSFVC